MYKKKCVKYHWKCNAASIDESDWLAQRRFEKFHKAATKKNIGQSHIKASQRKKKPLSWLHTDLVVLLLDKLWKPTEIHQGDTCNISANRRRREKGLGVDLKRQLLQANNIIEMKTADWLSRIPGKFLVLVYETFLGKPAMIFPLFFGKYLWLWTISLYIIKKIPMYLWKPFYTAVAH